MVEGGSRTELGPGFEPGASGKEAQPIRWQEQTSSQPAVELPSSGEIVPPAPEQPAEEGENVQASVNTAHHEIQDVPEIKDNAGISAVEDEVQEIFGS